MQVARSPILWAAQTTEVMYERNAPLPNGLLLTISLLVHLWTD